MANMRWNVGSVEVLRVPYSDIGLPADSIGLTGVGEATSWAEPWLSDGLPTVGQAFWVVRSGDTQVVIDPTGASDAFLRSGPDAVGHQDAAFALLRASGCDPDEVDAVVLTHLDGIGMAALADGGEPGHEVWTPAFPNASVVVSAAEYEHIAARGDIDGGVPFRQLDQLGAVQAVATPHQLAPGVTMQLQGVGHSPGHCCIEIQSEGQRAVLLGHLAISPLHGAETAQHGNHVDGPLAETELRQLLVDAAETGTLLAGSLWPTPGMARVTGTGPFQLVPAEGELLPAG